MGSALCFLKNPLSWLSVLGPVLILAFFFLGQYGFLSILLTSTILILSTVIFEFSKQRPKLVEKSVADEIPGSNQESSPHIEDVTTPVAPENCITENEEPHEEEEEEEEARSSTVMSSESNCNGRSSTSEDSEVDWDNMFRSPDCSDGSISDEDSLIEIALPIGHYIDLKEDEPKSNLHKKFPDFVSGLLFEQHGVMELFAELNETNEEENLIEIDISMGSIKCPRFEIEA